MADIELVVKISEEVYKHILKAKSVPDVLGIDMVNIINAVKNSSPLPKGHGRIKDIDKIDWYGCTTAFNCPYKDRDCMNCDRVRCDKMQVDAIPTIIEADRSEE